MEQMSATVLEDSQLYELRDLVNSDFDMSPNDEDYKLGHDHLVKVCKILLHKINFNNLRNAQERELMLNKAMKNQESIEQSTRSSMEEVNQFLHTVHQDLETFLKKHKIDFFRDFP